MTKEWLERLRHAAAAGGVERKLHALECMLERNIRVGEVLDAIVHGELVECYPDRRPFPACLMLRIDDAPLHVVVAYSPADDLCHVITAYRPSPGRFRDDWKTRR